jgi:hypothetical protein
MQLIINLNRESAQQLAEIQKYTNQEQTIVCQQAIGLYHQQIQISGRVQLEEFDRSELDCNYQIRPQPTELLGV